MVVVAVSGAPLIYFGVVALVAIVAVWCYDIPERGFLFRCALQVRSVRAYNVSFYDKEAVWHRSLPVGFAACKPMPAPWHPY